MTNESTPDTGEIETESTESEALKRQVRKRQVAREQAAEEAKARAAYDPFTRVTAASTDLVGTQEGFVYSTISARDYRGSALDEMRLRLKSQGYTRAEGVTSPHNPQAEVWCRPQAVEDDEFRAKKFDLVRRRVYAESLLQHPEWEPRKKFRDLVLGFHGLGDVPRVSLSQLEEACRAYPVHPGPDED